MMIHRLVVCFFLFPALVIAQGDTDDPPRCDIKVNGYDTGVVVPLGNSLQIDIDVEARDGAGYNCDVFVLIKPDWGSYYCHNGIGFQQGLGSYFTGPLFDIIDTVFIGPAHDLGRFIAYVGIDSSPNGRPTPSKVVVQDQCVFEIRAMESWVEYFEDGVANGWAIGPSPGNDCWYVGPTTNLAGQSYHFENLRDPFYDWHSTFYVNERYSDLTYQANMSWLDGSHHYYYGMILRSDGVGARSNGYVCYLKKSVNRFAFDVYKDGVQNTVATSYPFFTNMDEVKVVARGSRFDCYFNGNLEFTVNNQAHAIGYVGLMGQGSTALDNIFEFDDVSVTL